MRHIDNEHGLTLIEIIIVIMLMGIMVAVGVQFLYKSAEVDQINTARVKLVTDARFAMESLVRELRFADPTSVALPGTRVQFDKQFGYAVDTTTAGLEYRYFPVTDILQRTGSATTTIATNMTAFNVTDNGGWYTIELTMSNAIGGSFSLTSAVWPRTP